MANWTVPRNFRITFQPNVKVASFRMPLPVLRFKDLAHAPRFQLWTDALTFRQMATEAPNNYLKSMCVRNAVISACTALEMGCCDALAIPEINRFTEDVNAAFRQAGKTAIDFGSGLWQRILKIRDSRHEYAHSGVSISDRFPSAHRAPTTDRNWSRLCWKFCPRDRIRDRSFVPQD